MKTVLIWFVISLALVTSAAGQAQPILFEDTATLTGQSLPGITYTSASFADYNGDGRADFVFSGFNNPAGRLVRIYESHGDGTFSDIGAPLPQATSGATAWGDFDGDGDPDLFLTGLKSDDSTVAKIYRNDGGVFSEVSAAFPGVFESTAAWADFNNDGKLDLFYAGRLSPNSTDKITKIYRNNGDGTFTDTNVVLPVGAEPVAAIADYNGDSLPDIFFYGTGRTYLLQNNGNFSFSQVDAGFPVASYPAAAWGDYNGDGRPDLVLTGVGGNYVTTLYRNDGGGVFTALDPGFTGTMKGAARWGDYNGDGRLDLLLCGDTVTNAVHYKVCNLNRNDGADSFTNIGANLVGTYQSSADFGDFDGDGDLDILIAGDKGGDVYTAKVYRNSSPSSISGTVSSGSAPLSGVTVHLSGKASGSTTTDVYGQYAFSGLYSGSYSVDASLAPYTFTPASRSISLNESAETADFVDANVPTPTRTFTPAPPTQTSTPVPTSTCTATPVATATATPTPTPLPADTPTPVPTATPEEPVADGTITGSVTENGAPVGGVSIRISGPLNMSAETDEDGDFTFIDLPNGTYEVVPSDGRYTFSPPALTVSLSEDDNLADVSFAAQKKVLPDLVIRKVTNQARGEAGKSVTVVVTVQNRGHSPSGAFGVGIYLVPEKQSRRASDLIIQKTVRSISASKQAAKSIRIKLPSDFPRGRYRVEAAADPDDTISEEKEGNNGRASSKIIQIK